MIGTGELRARVVDADTEACIKLRAAVIDFAWRDLKRVDSVRSALGFFESSRFDWWSGGGVDLSQPREQAREVAAGVRREHVADMRLRLDSTNNNVRHEAQRFFRGPDSA